MQREISSRAVAGGAPATRRRRPRWRAPIVLGAFVLLICGLGLWSSVDPALVPDAVDLARSVVGPDPVAQVETWVFQAQDALRSARYQTTGAAPSVRWAAPVAPPSAGRAAPARRSSGAPLAAPAPAAAAPVAPAASGIWAPFVYGADGQPVLERAIVAPDPSRPYVQAALVRIDLRMAQLHLVAGTLEPRSSVRVARPGVIPAADQRPGRLLAAFNGGFKAINGSFGMAVNKLTLLPPIDGLATLALYRDGRVRLGVWGADVRPAPDLIAYRQNCPLLLDGGALTAQAETDNPALWGSTVKNKVATWRSGLGLSADGRYLVYATGDGLTVPALAEALVQGGADRAMQLDINNYWTRFVTYASTGGGRLEAQKLIDGMAGGPRQFLTPDSRDFFYVTAR